jgi:hypothetical protein
MRLLINCFESIGGNHYTVVPTDLPTEVAELGGGKVIEVSDERGEQIMKQQADAITFQCDMALIHAGQKNP